MEHKTPLLTRTEAMKYLRLSHGTLNTLMREGSIRYIKVRKKVMFLKYDLDEFIKSQAKGSTPS